MSVLTITKDNFESEVIKSDKPVLIDFWAEWCGPCRMMSPTVDKFAEANDDVKVGKINVDQEPELAIQFKVMSIPTLKLFEGGEDKKTQVGVISAEQLDAFVRG